MKYTIEYLNGNKIQKLVAYSEEELKEIKEFNNDLAIISILTEEFNDDFFNTKYQIEEEF